MKTLTLVLTETADGKELAGVFPDEVSAVAYIWKKLLACDDFGMHPVGTEKTEETERYVELQETSMKIELRHGKDSLQVEGLGVLSYREVWVTQNGMEGKDLWLRVAAFVAADKFAQRPISEVSKDLCCTPRGEYTHVMSALGQQVAEGIGGQFGPIQPALCADCLLTPRGRCLPRDCKACAALNPRPKSY